MVDTIQKINPFNRPPRQQEAFNPVEIDIPAPPNEQDEQTRNILLTLLPMTSFLMMGVFYGIIYSFAGRGMGGGGLLFTLPMIFMGIFTVAISLVVYGEQKHQMKVKRIKQMRTYHRLLDKKEARLLAAEIIQLHLLNQRFSTVDELLKKVQDLELTLWERRPDDVDFLCLRLGKGKVNSVMNLRPPDPDLDAEAIRRAFGIYTRFREVHAAPVTISLRSVGTLGIIGRRNDRISLTYSLLGQIAAYHSPLELNLYLFSSEQYHKGWHWLRWLPHVSSETLAGKPTNMAFKVKSTQELVSDLSKRLDERIDPENGAPKPFGPYILVILDGDNGVREEPVFSQLVQYGQQLNAGLIVLGDTLEDVPSECQSVIEIVSRMKFKYWKIGEDAIKHQGTIETMSLRQIDNLAHRLIPVGISALNLSGQIPSKINLLQTYQVLKLEEFLLEARWNRPVPDDGLLPFPVLIGNIREMEPLELHLAENIHGPHGIVAGTTGSGKSELLQTLVSALALEHHPYFLNFLLIDFKGGSAFGAFRDLPHTVGLISNLDRTSALRALEAIKAENLRRQQFLLNRGVEDILEYHEAIAEKGISSDWEPLPHLFIIVDEFAQLAREMPDFLPELMALLRVGRSLGLHLILATQRPAGVVNDDMRSNLNFRICLRVQTIDDSRDLLNRPDAAMLPNTLPGRAYFQIGDGGIPRQFQTARVGIEYQENDGSEKGIVDEPIYQIDMEELDLLYAPAKPDKKKSDEKRLKIHEILAVRMSEFYAGMVEKQNYRLMDPILLEPLPEEMLLRNLFEIKDAADSSDDNLKIRWTKRYIGGWNGKDWDKKLPWSGMKVPVGRVDDLALRQQPLLFIDFQGKRGGHLLVLGTPNSGKTTFLRSLIHSLAYHYAPNQVHIYILSFAGRALENMKGFPHVGDVVYGSEIERIQRLIRHLTSILEHRKVLFGNLGLDNLADYNEKHSNPYLPAVIVLIENFGELRDANYLGEMEEIIRLIENGRNYGVYFVITMLQIDAVPYKILNLIEQRAALNLTEKSDYLSFVGRPYSLDFGSLPSGRGLWSGTPPLQFQFAIHDIYLPSTQEEMVEATGNQIESTWTETLMFAMNHSTKEKEHCPKLIETLPTRINLSTLGIKSQNGAGKKIIPIGIDSDTLLPFRIDWWNETAHLLVGGPSQSGRTSLLHTIVLSIVNSFLPQEAWILLVDGALGSLRRLAVYPHVLAWISTEEEFVTNIAFLEEELRHRRELARENKLTGKPHIFLIIDDYDLTSEAIAIPQKFLNMLGKTIRRDSELGFHFILSNISQNLSRDYDPMLKQLKLIRSGVSLGNVEALEALGGRTTTTMRKQELQEGRAYMLNGQLVRLVQFAYPDEEMYGRLNEEYKGRSHARWEREPSHEVVEIIDHASSQGETNSAVDEDWIGDIDELVKIYVHKRQEEIDEDKQEMELE
jgi:DNA segregation ATPase FtsK/SpoIIIE, S-DNA-T family